jgi:hypothetical protein
MCSALLELPIRSCCNLNLRLSLGSRDAARQHLAQENCGGCHNSEEYTGGAEFEVFDPRQRI